MTRQLEFTRRARADLDDIIDFSVAMFGKRVADNYLDRLEAAFETLKQFPDIGSCYVANGADYRRFQTQRHYIYYTFSDTSLTIARVVHVSQNQRKALRR